MGGTYSGLINKNKLIQETLKDEEENYLNTLSKGLDLINKLTKSKNELSGENIFKLYDTFGFPSEIIQEIAAEKKLKLDMKQFNSLMDKQKLTSRKASNFDIKDASFIDAGLSSFSGYNEYQFTSKILALYIDDKKVEKIDKADTELMVVFEKTPFYPEGGGQISDVGKASNNSSVLEVKNVQKVKNTIIHHAVLKKGTVSIRDEYELEIDAARRGKITVNHSATHLLNQALRDTLGDHVEQKGSLVTDKYLRFDFSHNKALTSDELRKIESIISFEINSNRDTQEKVMPYKDAISSGALAFFDEKYSDNVRVVNIGTKSMELCGGTHVENTTTIRLFKILNESSISTGIRRIEALTGDEAFHSYQSLHDEMKKISKVLNIKNTNILDKINLIKQSEENSMSSINDLNKQIAKLYFEKISFKKNKIKQTFCYIEDCSDISIDQIKILSDVVKANHEDSISVLLKQSKDIINCYVGVSKQCKHRYNAKQIIEELSKKFMSKGGGSPTFATSVIPNQDAKTIIDYLNKIL